MKILATDASPEFGFGVSRAYCGSECGRRVCCLAVEREDYFRFFPSPGDHPEVDRLGTPDRLNLCMQDFTDVPSRKAKWQAHSSILESHGLCWA